MTKNLIELVEKAKAGDKSAFTELLDTIKLQLYKTALVRLENEHDALDAVQEAIFKAFSNIGTLRENRFFKTWIIRILLNECYNIEKYKKKVVSLDTFADCAEHDSESSCIEHMDIRNITSKLDVIYREVIDLRYNHDLKLEDIALVLDIPLGTVKSRINKAHSLLRAQLGTNYLNKEVSS